MDPARPPGAVERDPETRCTNGRCAPPGPARPAGQPGSAERCANAKKRTPIGEKYMTVTAEAPTRARKGKEAAGPGTAGLVKSRRPSIRPRGSLVVALDIGTNKICCFIARVEDDNPRVLGIGHQI